MMPGTKSGCPQTWGHCILFRLGDAKEGITHKAPVGRKKWQAPPNGSHQVVGCRYPLMLQMKTHFLPKVGRYTDGVDVRCYMTTFLVNIMKFTVCLEQEKCFYQSGRRIRTEWNFPTGLHLRTVPHLGCWLGGQGHTMVASPTKSGGVKMCYSSETSPKPLKPQWVWRKLNTAILPSPTCLFALQVYLPLDQWAPWLNAGQD